MGKSNKKNGSKRKRSDNSTPPIKSKMAANVNTQGDPTRTPVSNQLNNVNGVLYGQPTPVASTPHFNTPCNTPYQQNSLMFVDQGQSPNLVQTPTINSILADIFTRLDKLDILPVINNRLERLELKIHGIETEIVDIKSYLNSTSDRITSGEQRSAQIEHYVGKIEYQNKELYNENIDLKESILEMQTRSMRDNLIFTNLPDTDRNETPEQSEIVVKQFITDNLEVTGDIPFHVVHRLRPRPDNKPRSIVAKFERRKDRNMILQKAFDKREELKATGLGVYEQLPKEIGDRRNELFPIFKREQRNRRDVKFSGDRLIVDGRRIYPSSLRRKLPIHSEMNTTNQSDVRPSHYPHANQQVYRSAPPQNQPVHPSAPHMDQRPDVNFGQSAFNTAQGATCAP